MNKDEILERMRADARALRYEPPDEAVFTRLRANVRSRVERPAGVFDLIVRWRSLIASGVAAVAAITIVSSMLLLDGTPDHIGSIAENALLSEDFYSAAR